MEGSVRGRIGFALQNDTVLPFVGLGATLAANELSYSNENGDSYDKQYAQLGWLVSAGMEWKLAPSWSFRAEYQFFKYLDGNLRIPTIYQLNDAHGVANANSWANQLQIAVNYWF